LNLTYEYYTCIFISNVFQLTKRIYILSFSNLL